MKQNRILRSEEAAGSPLREEDGSLMTGARQVARGDGCLEVV